MNYFKPIYRSDLQKIINYRPLEIKLGQKVNTLYINESFEETISKTNAKYIIIGIPESIGVKANYGKPGTEFLWKNFLSSFLNMQSNFVLKGDCILIAGYFDFTELELNIFTKYKNRKELINKYREGVSIIDNAVSPVIKFIVQQNKIPIVIGGGHNNAFPCIKGAVQGLKSSKKLKKSGLDIINFDAHADLRPLEGRHSGNAFSYAFKEKLIKNYLVIGLQESYLIDNTYKFLKSNPNIKYLLMENIMKNKDYAASYSPNHFTKDYLGVEFDLDVIEHTQSSAMSPSGFSVNMARNLITSTGQFSKIAYLHICEGAIFPENDKLNTVGKLVAFLVRDFIKTNFNLNNNNDNF